MLQAQSKCLDDVLVVRLPLRRFSLMYMCEMANLWNTHCPAKNCFRVWLEIVCGWTTRTKNYPLPIYVIFPYFHSIHCTYYVFLLFHFRVILLSFQFNSFLLIFNFCSHFFSFHFSLSLTHMYSTAPDLLHLLLPSGLLHSTPRSLFVRFVFVCVLSSVTQS